MRTFPTELEVHPEIGGTNLEAAQHVALGAIDHCLPKTESAEGKVVRSAMDKSGYNNYRNPKIIWLTSVNIVWSLDAVIDWLLRTANIVWSM